MKQSFEDANMFLQILDPYTNKFTFQTFDNAKTKNPLLSHIFHGTLKEHWNRLVKLNNIGAGIYVVFNKTDLTGRKIKNINAVRGVFFENDTNVDITTVPLEATMITRTSKNKGHMYYLVDKPAIIDNLKKDQFASMMEHLIDLGSDKNAKDLARVLRLPGFYNMAYKTPEMVKIVRNTGIKYSWQHLTSYLCKPLEPKPRKPILTDEIEEIALIYSALQAIDPDEEYNTWLQIGMALHHESNGSEEGFHLFDQWSGKGVKYKGGDCESKWKSFSTLKDNTVTKNTLYKIAWNSGWNGKYTPNIKYVNQENQRKLKKFDENHGVINFEGKVYIVIRNKSSRGFWTTQFLKKADLELLYQNVLIPSIKMSKHKDPIPLVEMKPVVPTWLQWHKRKTFTNIEFAPHKDIQLSLSNPKKLPNKETYNLYLGLTNPGKPGSWNNIKQHILEVWCNDDLLAYEYVINWLSNMFQNPGNQGFTCLVLKSDLQGAGKNIITDIITSAFGEFGVSVSSNNSITGDFNALFAKSICFVASEAVWAGSNKAKGQLKGYITDTTVECEEKFQPRFTIKNCTHLIFLSNEDWNAPVELNDRRYFVLDVNNKYVKNHDYFSNLSKAIKDGEGDAFIYYLRTRNQNGFIPQQMPQIDSDAKTDNIISGLNSVEAYIISSLYEGTFITSEFVNEHADVENAKAYTTNQLYTAYKDFIANEMGQKCKPCTKQMFIRKLKRFLGTENFYRRLITFDEKRQWGYKISPIQELRKIIEIKIGSKMQWESVPLF